MNDIRRELEGLIRVWQSEAAAWRGYGDSEPDPYRRGGWAERSAIYDKCAEAAAALLKTTPDVT